MISMEYLFCGLFIMLVQMAWSAPVASNNCSTYDARSSLFEHSSSAGLDVMELILDSQRGDTGCPADVPNSQDSPKYQRSVCPWYYELNHDNNRSPAFIANAVSRCPEPVSSSGLDKDKYVCEQIMRDVTVITRQENVQCPGAYVYEEKTISIVVGSVAARRREVENSSPADDSEGPQPIA